jgi:hypothetical protein
MSSNNKPPLYLLIQMFLLIYLCAFVASLDFIPSLWLKGFYRLSEDVYV